jgi:hypothetical protein
LFRNLVFIPTIAENPTSQMYEDEKGSSTFKASVERVGHVCSTDSQNCVNFLRLKISFNVFKSFRDPPVWETPD